MKTTLHFEGPSDLSVGTIRIYGQGQSIADWVATPGNVTFQAENIEPGIYATDIEPAGVAPQSVIFEVHAGEPNKVILPPFSLLSASGGNTSYFDTCNQKTFDRLPTGLNLDGLERPVSSIEGAESPAPGYFDTHNQNTFDRLPTGLNLDGLERPVSTIEGAERPVPAMAPRREIKAPVRRSKQTSCISIGLSEGARGTGSLDTLRRQTKMGLFPSRVELDVPDDPQRDPWSSRRIRLALAIERIRLECCLMPLYRGGTKITVSTPSFNPADVEFNVTPIDPRTRALLRALDAGTSAEAEAVCKSIVCKVLENEPSAAADPWAAMLLGLLSVRFPQIFTMIDDSWTASLAERAGWAFDTHVIHASHILAAAHDNDTAAKHEAVAQVMSLFATAAVANRPYFRYTNQLFAEMVDGIAYYLEQDAEQVSATTAARFERVRQRWYRELPLQRGAGATYTSLAADAIALRSRALLVPDRRPSGWLPRHGTVIVFEGELSAGRISMLREPTPSLLRDHANSNLDDDTLSDPILGDLTSSNSFSLGGTWSQILRAARTPERLTVGLGTGLSKTLRRLLSGDDPNKGRFGGQSHRDGFRLDANFDSADQQWATVILTVTADDASRIGLEDYACFVLHPTFSPPEVNVSFRIDRAQLRILAWGGFTVGVRLPRANVVLEYDLAQDPLAPDIIKTR